jgi:hypothetical protein
VQQIKTTDNSKQAGRNRIDTQNAQAVTGQEGGRAIGWRLGFPLSGDSCCFPGFFPQLFQPIPVLSPQHTGEQTGKREQYDVLEEVEEGHFPNLTDIFFLAKAWILACHRHRSTIDGRRIIRHISMKYLIRDLFLSHPSMLLQNLIIGLFYVVYALRLPECLARGYFQLAYHTRF